MTQTELTNRVNAMVPFVFADRFNPVVFAFPPASIGDDKIVEYNPTCRYQNVERSEGEMLFTDIYSLDGGFVGVHFVDTDNELRLLGAEKFGAFDEFESIQPISKEELSGFVEQLGSIYKRLQASRDTPYPACPQYILRNLQTVCIYLFALAHGERYETVDRERDEEKSNMERGKEEGV